MEIIFFIFFVITLLFFTIINAHKYSSTIKGNNLDLTYVKIDKLFTDGERSFLGVLDNIIGEDYRVFGKIRIADTIKAKGKNWRSGFNKISAKHFDYVICRKDDLSIIGAIELNDKSHHQKHRQKRDKLITEICISANIPLLFIQAKKSYSQSETKELIKSSFNI